MKKILVNDRKENSDVTNANVNVKKDCIRISARTTTLIEKGVAG